MTYSVEELKELTGMQFSLSDAEFVDSLYNHQTNCYVAAHREAVPRAVAEAKDCKEFFALLRKYAMESAEKFPVSLDISQRTSCDLNDMVYAYRKGVQKEAADGFAKGTYWQDVLYN